MKGAFQQTFLERSNVVGYPEDVIAKPEKDGYDAVIEFLHELGVANRGVGFELDELVVGSVEKFKATGDSLHEGGRRYHRCGIMRAAEIMRHGVREAAAMAEIVGTLVRGANGNAGRWIAAPILCSSPRTGTGHITWNEDFFRQGSQINLEIAGLRHTISRTSSIGKPSDRLARA
ncbi:hypothetical protein ACE10Z_35400 [Bradyrhizobium sp. Pha-3]|uniref:hypothetical protein n=1 Tax=Bradyrhizobium sp. Pha-3 TaxID=208375 RepID=UPI0035D4294B